MQNFRAYRIDRQHKKVVAGLCNMSIDELTEGDVLIRVSHSTINYKDALAVTGAGRILKKYPLNGGIDLAGTVVSSDDERFHTGDGVLVTGGGLSETLDGGYAEYARVPANVVVPLPEGVTAEQAMQIGTAGFTAALAIHRMEQNGQRPEDGPIVVTGATGGVGSLALDMLDVRGFEAIAVTSKAEQSDYLKAIGARSILLREDIDLGSRPLEAAQWAGAIDSLGGETLAWLLRTVGYGGNVASIGLAQSFELNTTVMPFILRAVCLLGVSSVNTPRDLRLQVWSRIGEDLRPRHLERINTRKISLDELPGVFQGYLEGAVTGRTVVVIQ